LVRFFCRGVTSQWSRIIFLKFWPGAGHSTGGAAG
jgi:hypothetical protein